MVRALDEAGIAVESLELVQPTLDDVFVAKTGHHLEKEESAASDEEPVERVSEPGDERRGWCGRWACARSARPSAARS